MVNNLWAATDSHLDVSATNRVIDVNRCDINSLSARLSGGLLNDASVPDAAAAAVQTDCHNTCTEIDIRIAVA